MPQSVVLNSIEAAGFDVDVTCWFKWNHDVYGEDPFNLDDINVSLNQVDAVE
ncbi:hypothetical protein L914_11640 [Phytophthora nicotianae]|uniref:Uncharacterized protein n=1 Tax=Phytophthora nicotianae TaxID=4792 RepID=W2N4Z6_PHYNI|nr:hypothetical protein L914_11640 [Phytophthora nicotianae]